MTAAPFHADVADAPQGTEAVWIRTEDDVRLRAALSPGGTGGTAVIFPGRTEFAEKYGRVACSLQARGLAVAVIDWRGQGLSDRPPDRPMLGHIDDFKSYQRDVAALLALLAARGLPEPYVLVAHSMGGAIGLRTLVEHPRFSKAIFSAPMWQLHMKMATREITTRLARLAGALGLGKTLTPGANPGPTAVAVGFEENALTSDRDTFDWCVRQISAHPDLALGGPSVQWTYAALQETARLYLMHPPPLPTLVLVGSAETVVSARAIERMVGRMTGARVATLAGARHEVFMERPEVLRALWAEVDHLLAGDVPGVSR